MNPTNEQGPNPPAHTPAERDRLGSKRALVVDDDPAFTILVERLLQEAGFQVVKAHTMDDALDQAITFQPHVALLDVQMPGDGIDACSAITTGLKKPPVVIMVTGSDSTKTFERAMAAGASDYINKPFKWEELVPLIESHLQHRKAT